ncbi:MAG TPA: UbiA family prenyltransferase [Steroidobacteraceae bacterium]|nr:UbiA family prenyltransferase [Steroidobacteraceae bacterium]
MSNISSELRELRAGALLPAALESLRTYQWLKNALVFVPLAAAHRLGEPQLLLRALYVFVAFSLCASGIYLLNDLWDASVDRVHPHKQLRPIASGRLPRSAALVLAAALLVAALAAAWPLGLRTAAALGAYLALMVAYTLRLKAIVLLDALVLAGGYALRVLAGGLAVAIIPSARLLAFCIFLFFSLALVKRYAELALLRLRDGPAAHARAYLLEDQEFIVALGTSCGALSVLVLALYMSSATVVRLYSRAEFIWVTCVLLLYWISHMWLMAHRGRMTDDPLVFAVKNRVSAALIVLMGATAWLAV